MIKLHYKSVTYSSLGVVIFHLSVLAIINVLIKLNKVAYLGFIDI